MAIAFSLVASAADPVKLVLWNQHNGKYGDRGTKACTVEVFANDSSIWKSGKIDLAWSPSKDEKAEVMIPSLPLNFDRVRVSILKWAGHGGGLSEIELWHGDKNLARKAKVTASDSYKWRPFVPEAVIDGITSSSAFHVGYWLLPDKTGGWIDLKIPRWK